MLTSKVKNLSVVKLVDGREATILEVFDYPDKPLAYLVEIVVDGNGPLVDVMHDQVEAVIWDPEA